MFPLSSNFLIIFSTLNGDKNWPFFTLTTLPVFAAAINRSVCLQRNAGIWIISTTSLTASACSGKWMSVVTGILNECLISSKILSPLSRPLPRNEDNDVLFALSQIEHHYLHFEVMV